MPQQLQCLCAALPLVIFRVTFSISFRVNRGLHLIITFDGLLQQGSEAAAAIQDLSHVVEEQRTKLATAGTRAEDMDRRLRETTKAVSIILLVTRRE